MSNELPLEIDCQTVAARLAAGGDFLLLDCRERPEWDTVHIDQAMLLPMSELVARAGELERYRNSQVTVHCHHGGRSLNVANWLRQQGFAQAQSMSGGIDRWACEIDQRLPRY